MLFEKRSICGSADKFRFANLLPSRTNLRLPGQVSRRWIINRKCKFSVRCEKRLANLSSGCKVLWLMHYHTSCTRINFTSCPLTSCSFIFAKPSYFQVTSSVHTSSCWDSSFSSNRKESQQERTSADNITSTGAEMSAIWTPSSQWSEWTPWKPTNWLTGNINFKIQQNLHVGKPRATESFRVGRVLRIT